MLAVVYWLTLGAELLSAGAAAYSALCPVRRIWPPRGRGWRAYLMWLLFGLSGLGALALGALDWGSLTLASWLRWAVGAPLWLSGMLLALWATGALGLGRTLGDEGALATRGPYRWLRHPQYLGYGAALLGWALLAGSARTLLAAGMGAGAFLMAAWAEETEREMEDRRVR